jgi:hypothetical protein
MSREYKIAYAAWKARSPEKRVNYVERYARLTMDMTVDGFTEEGFIMCDSMHAVFFDLTEKEIRGALAAAQASKLAKIPPTNKVNIKHN